MFRSNIFTLFLADDNSFPLLRPNQFLADLSWTSLLFRDEVTFALLQIMKGCCETPAVFYHHVPLRSPINVKQKLHY